MLMRNLSVVLGQINPIVGDIDYNLEKVIKIVKNHQNVDLIIFPEMALVGYPLMDHIFDPIIRKLNLESVEKIKKLNSRATIIIGTFTEPLELRDSFQPFYNSAIVIEGNKIKYIENKRLIPNYDVFDERRYFSFDNKFKPVEIKGVKVGILVCEDIWDETYNNKVSKNLVSNGAEILTVINASPFHINKFNLRKDLIKRQSKKLSVSIIYLNMVGGIDEIVYDGQSFITNKFGQIVFKAKAFEEDVCLVEIPMEKVQPVDEKSYKVDWRENTVKALELNLFDYYHKSGVFKGVC